jgi:LytS/YehU family sensor histidine kinase
MNLPYPKSKILIASLYIPIVAAIMLPWILVMADGIDIQIRLPEKILLSISFFFYVAAWIVIAIYVYIIWIQKKTKQKQEQQQQLQIELLEQKLDSHFTFNVLNSLAVSILKDDRKEAYQQLITFSKVLRFTYDNKFEFKHSLGEELELTKNYIKLEKYRFKDKFTSEIVIAPEVNLTTGVPKHIIQLNVDNAIRHGLIPLKSDGRLTIKLRTEENSLYIEVEDNGIGREAAGRMNKMEKKGTSLKKMKRLIQFLNQQEKSQTKMRFYDIMKDGNPAGTRVEIVIEN